MSSDYRDEFSGPPTARPAGGPEYGGPPFPGVVTAAGVIWIGVGALALVNFVLGLVAAGAAAAANPGAPQAPGGGGGGCCGLVIGIAFLAVGLQTVKGTAKDTLGNGVGSILLGLLYGAVGLGAGALVGFGAANGRANGEEMAILAVVLMVMVGGLGLALILAGILALVGRTPYREWRRANKHLVR